MDRDERPSTGRSSAVPKLLGQRGMKVASPASGVRLLSLGWGVFFAGCLISLVVAYLLHGILRQDYRKSFERSSIEIQRRLEERFRLYELSLLQIQAFAHAKKSIIRRDDLDAFEDSFGLYMENLDVTTLYPGSRGVGLLEKVDPEKRSAHLARRRRKVGREYRIWPEGNPGTTFPMIRMEPNGTDPQFFGVDHASDPIRAKAMSRALATGSVVASEPTQFMSEFGQVADSKRPWGFFLYVPLFTGRGIPKTQLERQNALLGYAFTSFRFDYLILRAVPPPYPASVGRIQLVSDKEKSKIYFDSGAPVSKLDELNAFDLELKLPGVESVFFLRVFPTALPFFSHVNFIPILAALLGFLLSFLLLREMQRRELTRNALEIGIATRTKQLNTLLEEQRHTNAELKVLNEDLESFGYSVSHDLRAPLRGIDGFGAALEEEFSEELGEKGRYYVSFMRDGALRAARVLDDLLRLSRLSRTEPAPTRLDFFEIANEIIESLRQHEPHRKVVFETTGEREAIGDVGLVRIALENLLSNAWKFTQGKETAHILLRGTRVDSEIEIEVEDDGAGFPPEHASQLFGVFRRLHTEKEFPGTGVGLATVKRIAMKHAGRVWARNREGGGGIFGFSLPAP